MGQVLWFADGFISVPDLQSTWHLLVSDCCITTQCLEYLSSMLVASDEIACWRCVLLKLTYQCRMLCVCMTLILCYGRCMLEVWQAFPGINITGTAKSGFLLRLATRFLILVYQVHDQ